MNLSWGIIIVLIICSIFSGAIKPIRGKKEWFYVVPFFFVSYYFVVSAVKWYLGYHGENLLESFWDAQMVTYVHYGIPLIIIAIVAPLLLHVIFKQKKSEIIRYFDSSFFFTFSFAFLLVRKMNNQIYCVAYLLAWVATVLAAVLKKTKSHADADKDALKEKAVRALILTVYYLVTVVIYTPNELYLCNAEEFPMSYWYFFGKLIIAGIIIAVLLLIGMVLYLVKGQFEIYSALLFSLLTLGYIQGMFLNGNMQILDGTQGQTGLGFKEIFNIALWIVLLGISIIYCLKKRTAKKIVNIVSIWIILIQMVSLVVIIVSSKDTATKSELALTTDGMLEVNEENNIIVFILDKFDGRMSDELLEEDPAFFEPLRDFIYYENATSEFCPTGNSIPFLLTGTKYREDKEEHYRKYAFQGETLLTYMDRAKYDVGIYTDKRFVPEDMKDFIANYRDGIQRTCSMNDLFALMTQCSRYKMAPFMIKTYYMYDSSDISLLAVSDRITNIEDDLPFYNRLTKTGLSVSDSEKEGAFKFIHMHGAHPPYTMTEDFQHIDYDPRRDEQWGDNVSQTKGAMKIVYEYIRQLKELDKYEDAMIIITADHGAAYAIENEEGNTIRQQCPILFVKYPEKTQDNMVISHAPVSHADVVMSIKKKIGVNSTEKGMEDIDEHEDRTRISRVEVSGGMEKYEITGNVKDIKSWKLIP